MNRPNETPFCMILDNRMIEALSERSEKLTREQALIDLVGRCVLQPTELTKNGRVFLLKAGEAEVSFHTLARDWKWDRKTVRKFLLSLQEVGCLSLRHYPYGTVASFPTLITSPPGMDETSAASFPYSSPAVQTQGKDIGNGVPHITSTNPHEVSVLYDDCPLAIDGETRSRLKSVYETFQRKLPHLVVPEYGPRTEKAIYYVFILGMKGDMGLMDEFLDRVVADENMNGEMAELTGRRCDMESFISLFSPRWLEILFPAPSKAL